MIREGDEAVLIDGGNRDDFSAVMLKILRTGLQPAQIKRLIYQHYDPDLCGNLPQLEALINTKELRIISHAENNVLFTTTPPKRQSLIIAYCSQNSCSPPGGGLRFTARRSVIRRVAL